MPDNESGFVDFNQYSELNRDEQTRLLEAAMERAQTADRDTQTARLKAEGEATARLDKDERIVGSKSFSQAASYSDYLSAKGNAEKAWAAVSTQSRNPYEQALRGSIRSAGDLDTKSREAAAQRALGEEQSGADVTSAYERAIGRKQDLVKYRQTVADNEAASKAQVEASREKMRKQIRSQMAGDWAQADARQGTFGFDPGKTFTIYGENINDIDRWNPEANRLVQQARAYGLDAEADRYTSGATYEWGKRKKGGY